MHTEFVQILSGIIACFFVGGIIYQSYTTKSATEFSDYIELGYVERDNQPNVIIKETISNPIDEKLKQDCVDTLIKLGMKKTLARQRTNDEFSSNPPKSIQEFLKRVLWWTILKTWELT